MRIFDSNDTSTVFTGGTRQKGTMNDSFVHQLVSSHLVSNIMLNRANQLTSIEEEITRLFGLCQSSVPFQERNFYQTCWAQILDIAEKRCDNINIASLAYNILARFASKLSERSRDYEFYCERLLHCLHSAILSGRRLYSSSFECFETYLQCSKPEIVSNLFDRINKFCFLISQRSESSEYCLAAIAFWRIILIRGVSSKLCHLKYINLTLVLARIQIMAVSRDRCVKEAGCAMLQDLIESYKDAAGNVICTEVLTDDSLISQDMISLDTVDEFQEDEQIELEYFLRGSIVQKHHGIDVNREKLKQRLVGTFEYFSDLFSNQEMYNIEQAIQEGVDSSVESDLSILECILGRFLQITYKELTAMAQKSMEVESIQEKDRLSLKNTSGSKSIQRMIEAYKGCIIQEAEDIESKFLSYIVPHFRKILSG